MAKWKATHRLQGELPIRKLATARGMGADPYGEDPDALDRWVVVYDIDLGAAFWRSKKEWKQAIKRGEIKKIRSKRGG